MIWLTVLGLFLFTVSFVTFGISLKTDAIPIVVPIITFIAAFSIALYYLFSELKNAGTYDEELERHFVVIKPDCDDEDDDEECGEQEEDNDDENNDEIDDNPSTTKEDA